jgi:hypothetical protein
MNMEAILSNVEPTIRTEMTGTTMVRADNMDTNENNAPTIRPLYLSEIIVSFL